MPDLWDTNPDHVFGAPDEQPDPAPSGHDDPSNQVRSGTTVGGFDSPRTS